MDSELEVTRREENRLPPALPDAPALAQLAELLRKMRPAALATGALVGMQLRQVRDKPAIGALGVSAVLLVCASSVLDRFILAFDRLRSHLLAAGGAWEGSVLATRGGSRCIVDISSLVAGDIVHLEAGCRVYADCRIIEAEGLHVDHSFLPQHSSFSSHDPRHLLGNRGVQRPGDACEVTAAADREGSRVLDAQCVVLATGTVTSGRGTAVVTRTGERTAVYGLLFRLCSLGLTQALFSSWS